MLSMVGGLSVTMLDGTIIRSSYRGEAISFLVVNRKDLIQAHHLRGEFYELEELAIIERYFKKDGVFLDVGANVGNHVVYVGKFLQPRQLIVMEPNPPAIEVLKTNIELNRLGPIVDLTLIGIGLSDVEGSAVAQSLKDNLGATRLRRPSLRTKLYGGAPIRTTMGDELLSGRKIDFIKMDVEGMEIKALRGMEKLISENRPVIFVEVDVNNQSAFMALIQNINYTVRDRFKRYRENENFLIVPSESAI
jgi:FkbM family methyltransferase